MERAVVASMPAGLASTRCGAASSGKLPASALATPVPWMSSFCCWMALATSAWSAGRRVLRRVLLRQRGQRFLLCAGHRQPLHGLAHVL